MVRIEASAGVLGGAGANHLDPAGSRSSSVSISTIASESSAMKTFRGAAAISCCASGI
jgi:hypothetical protein